MRWSERLPAWARYLIATALVFMAAALRWLLDPWFGDNYPFPLFFAAVVVSAIFLERSSGILATLLSGFLVAVLFARPRYSLAMERSADVAALLIFLAVCMLIVTLAEGLRYHAGKLDEEERRNEALFLEVNYRTRHSLQIISSTLAVMAVKAPMPEIRTYLDAVAERVGRIGRIHERLFPLGAAAHIGALELVQGACNDIALTMAGQRPVVIRERAQAFPLRRELAASLAIIISELVDNAFRHAFPDGRAGAVTVGLDRLGDQAVLTVEDTGIGCSEDIGQGTGSTLVTALTQQLGGIALWEDAHPGCRVVVTVSLIA